MGMSMKRTWMSIDEADWNRYQVLPPGSSDLEVIRVRPDSSEYDQIVHIRYEALADSGFVDKDAMPPDCMRLERDWDSIILGCRQDGNLVGTATLNTVTDAYPAMAMELEKNGILTGIGDFLLLIGKYLGFTAREIRDKNRRMFITGDCHEVQDTVRCFNEQVFRDEL